MTANSELKTALYNRLTSTSTFNTNIGGRVYFQRAEDSPTYPYCVYSIFADNYSYDSANEWEEIYIQFSLFDENSSSSNISTLESNLIDLLDTTLTFTNFTQINLYRINKRYSLSENDSWNTIIEYRIEIEHN